eukprot:TRINITY_DN4620_c0_g1_i2.p1 TRINITY_DN4620_c0_g1~~TRINITY_DN4620_c0_g1_i2.p1  ORF type:complete len:784 (-),score=92.92 TRINITY_DN4620_c0_g1_i2:28-2352(-)
MNAEKWRKEEEGEEVPIFDRTNIKVTYKRKAVCRDWPCAILFLALTVPILVFGVLSVKDLSENPSLCSALHLPLSDEASTVPDDQAFNIYDNCLTFLITNKSDAKANCLSFGIDRLEQFAPAKVPKAVSEALATCILNIGKPNFARDCSSFALSLVLPNQMVVDIWDDCLFPIISNSTNSTESCLYYALDRIDPELVDIYQQCTTNRTNILGCVTEAFESVMRNDTQAQELVGKCVGPIIEKKASGAAGCLFFVLQNFNPETGPEVWDGCLVNVIENQDFSSCFLFSIDNLIGFDTSYNLFLDGLGTILEPDVLFNLDSSCLNNLIFSDNLGIDLTNCLLGNGIIPKFCHDLESLGLQQLKKYFDGFANTLWIYHRELIEITAIMLGVGVGLAFMWMVVVARWTKVIVQFTMGWSLFGILVTMGANFAFGNIPGGAFLGIYFLVKLLWYLWNCRRLGFVSAVLKTSLHCIKKTVGPFLIVTAVFVGQTVVCALYLAAYLKIIKDYQQTVWPEFLLVFSFFWTMEVSKNLLAVTIAGTIGTWYFYHGFQPFFPSLRALLRASVFSFGSICFGSAITASLALVMYWYKKAQNSDSPWVKAAIMAILCCVEDLLKTFNLYAFVRVGLYGKSYLVAAKDTLLMTKKSGLQALFNDDLVEGVLDTGKALGALAVCGTAGVVSWKYGLPWYLILMVMFVGLFFGHSILSIVAIVVQFSCATIFVCFALEPKVLEEKYPKFHKKLAKGWLKWHKRLPESQYEREQTKLVEKSKNAAKYESM